MFLYGQLRRQAKYLYCACYTIIEKDIGFARALKIADVDVQRRTPGASGCHGIAQADIARRRSQWSGGIHDIIASMGHCMQRIDRCRERNRLGVRHFKHMKLPLLTIIEQKIAIA